MRYVAVGGTWALKDHGNPDAWWQPGSAFQRAALLPAGWVPLRPEPFLWSTDVNGMDGWRRWFGWAIPERWKSGDQNDWHAGGAALRYYVGRKRARIAVIAHSHGGQVVAHACAQGLRIDRLITVATPVRSDVPWAQARPQIGQWTHLHATDGDRMQWLGAVGDGRWGVQRAMPLADINHGLPGVNHSKLLTDPQYWPLWQSQGWLHG